MTIKFQFNIEKNIPLPAHGGTIENPFEGMEINDSFLVLKSSYPTLYGRARKFNVRLTKWPANMDYFRVWYLGDRQLKDDN